MKFLIVALNSNGPLQKEILLVFKILPEMIGELKLTMRKAPFKSKVRHLRLRIQDLGSLLFELSKLYLLLYTLR